MNEANTRAELIDPLLTAAGWGVVDDSRIRREFSITLVPPGGIKGRRGVKHRPLGQVNAIGGRAIAGLAHMHLGPQLTHRLASFARRESARLGLPEPAPTPDWSRGSDGR